MKKIFKVLAFMFLAVAVFSCNHSAKKGKASQASTNQTEDMQKFIDELNAPPSTPIPSSISELSGEKKTEVENVLSEFKSSQAFLDAGLTESDIAPGKYNLYKSEYDEFDKTTEQIKQIQYCRLLVIRKGSNNHFFIKKDNIIEKAELYNRTPTKYKNNLYLNYLYPSMFVPVIETSNITNCFFYIKDLDKNKLLKMKLSALVPDLINHKTCKFNYDLLWFIKDGVAYEFTLQDQFQIEQQLKKYRSPHAELDNLRNNFKIQDDTTIIQKTGDGDFKLTINSDGSVTYVTLLGPGKLTVLLGDLKKFINECIKLKSE